MKTLATMIATTSLVSLLLFAQPAKAEDAASNGIQQPLKGVAIINVFDPGQKPDKRQMQEFKEWQKRQMRNINSQYMKGLNMVGHPDATSLWPDQDQGVIQVGYAW